MIALMWMSFCFAHTSSSAQTFSRDAIPAVPTKNFFMHSDPVFNSTTGEFNWIHSRTTKQFESQAIFFSWNPSTGDFTERLLPIEGHVLERVTTKNGVLLLIEKKKTAYAVLLTPQNKVIFGPEITNRYNPRMLKLDDQSVLVLGGSLKGERNSLVELVRMNEESLSVERVSDLPGKLRGGYSTSILNDGRLLVLGGNHGDSIGCGPCSAETYIFDPLLKSWSKGSDLIEPVAGASASLLPDGRVLVAGGWTDKFGWNEGSTRQTQMFDPRSGKFSSAPAMPISIAMHRAFWAPGEQGKRLLIAGGNSAAVLDYDVDGGNWRVVGESCDGDEKGATLVMPFVFLTQTFIWKHSKESDSNYCGTKKDGWELLPLRLKADSSSQNLLESLKKGIAFYRYESAFFSDKKRAVSILVGGAINTGGNASMSTAAVDAIWSDGRIQALLPLNHARRGAKIIGLADGGFLVIGGWDGKYESDIDRSNLPMEWLPGLDSNNLLPWQEIKSDLPKGTAFGNLATGEVIALTPTGNLSKLTIDHSVSGGPVIQLQTLSVLPRSRRDDDRNQVQIRGLADGRIVVAGGLVTSKAHLKKSDKDSEQQDSLISALNHDIFNPKTRSWQLSKPSNWGAEQVVILEDGRVVKLSYKMIEISSANGSVWRALSKKSPIVFLKYREARLFVQQGELFISGKELQSVDGPDMVEWFDTKRRRWEILWEAAPSDNSRLNVSRVVARRLANGKQVVFPIGGI